MNRPQLIETIKKILTTDHDLSFLIKLTETELETLVATIRGRVTTPLPVSDPGETMTLTKDDIADRICNQCGFSGTKSDRPVETILDGMKSTLESGEDVMLSRFGKFSVRSKKARRGRNPATGRDLALEARRVVTFHCSTVLRTRINGKGSGSD